MKKLILIISAICLFTAIPNIVNAEVQKLPDGFEQIVYTEEEIIEPFNQVKENGKLEIAIANILKESGKEGGVVIGSPIEVKRVNISEKEIKHFEMPTIILPVSQDGILIGSLYFFKVLNVNSQIENQFTYRTFISENFAEDLAKPNEEIALFMPTWHTPEYASGIFGIDRNNKRFILFNYRDPIDFSTLTFENVNAEVNILTAEDLKQNENFVYNKIVDITLGAGVEEPTLS